MKHINLVWSLICCFVVVYNMKLLVLHNFVFLVWLAGKVFVYWLGTEPFLYVAEAEFLKKMSSQVMGKGWGKPSVFKFDRKPMFGNGLVMTEGDEWVRHRHVITPAFNPINLKVSFSLISRHG